MSEPLPLRSGGQWRKRWRYVAAFDERVMLCAAVVEIGLLGQTFWAVWDRAERRMREHTRPRLPLFRDEVAIEGASVRVRARDVAIELELAPGESIEASCPNGSGGHTWTRKLAGAPVEGTVRTGGREHRIRGRAVDDESAGHHARRTSWLWSAGLGRADDGRDVAWNLVSGINDPATGSERAIWVDGAPAGEPAPVSFQGLESIAFEDGSRLSFRAEATRARSEGVPLLFHSDYEAPFGTFSGSLPGIELESGLGVMERHDAVW